jgi:hypothetical protein
MNLSITTRLPTRVGWCVAILFLATSLLPFTFIGESWGMVWFYVTAPISIAVEATVGIGRESYFLIGLTSVACAAAWAAVAYAFTRMIQRRT